ncbi:MAG: NAD(P)-dependent oxidoreductase, partial [Alphaproteobacteria bacterium]|nr:NAD(P)-dependent oxidoreductase [Alphaproteobacteria bacterium]
MATILITGAAGRIGAALRTGLADTATTLRLSDLKPIDRLAPRESFHLADLRDFAAVRAAVAGSDAVVHLGGIPIDDTFENILDHNIRGTYHVYEA